MPRLTHAERIDKRIAALDRRLYVAERNADRAGAIRDRLTFSYNTQRWLHEVFMRIEKRYVRRGGTAREFTAKLEALRRWRRCKWPPVRLRVSGRKYSGDTIAFRAELDQARKMVRRDFQRLYPKVVCQWEQDARAQDLAVAMMKD